MYTATKQSSSPENESPNELSGKDNVKVENEEMTTEEDQVKVIDKLHKLQVDCSLLNDFIERVLLSSGICKRYTHPKELTYCNLKQRDGHCSSEIELEVGHKNKQDVPKTLPQSRPQQILIHPSAFKEKLKIYRHPVYSSASQRQQFYLAQREPSFDRYTIAAFQRIRGGGPKKAQAKWVPRTTIPQPFKMTMREQHLKARSTYSKRFLEKMLREKREKQLAELREHQKIFKANPVPKTTYTPDLPAKIGQLKHRSKSVNALQNIDKNPVRKKFHSNPVPLSTFFRPVSSDEGRRKQQRFQRALTSLATASMPGHMNEHSIRWKIQQKIRHVPKCFQRQDKTNRIRSKSVPDFRRLHRDFDLKLQDLKLFRPPTLVEPFHFNSDYPKHYCKEWTFAKEEMVQKEKRAMETNVQ